MKTLGPAVFRRGSGDSWGCTALAFIFPTILLALSAQGPPLPPWVLGGIAVGSLMAVYVGSALTRQSVREIRVYEDYAVFITERNAETVTMREAVKISFGVKGSATLVVGKRQLYLSTYNMEAKDGRILLKEIRRLWPDALSEKEWSYLI